MWKEDDELMVRFPNGPEVAVVPLDPDDMYEFYDVYVNSRFTHTCAFRTGFNALQMGVLCTIIRDNEHVRIAESPDSTCVPAHQLFKMKAALIRFASEKPLRNRVLKANAERTKK